MKRHLTSFTGPKLKSLASWLPVRVANYKITTLSTALSQRRFCKLLKCHSSCAVSFPSHPSERGDSIVAIRAGMRVKCQAMWGRGCAEDESR